MNQAPRISVAEARRRVKAGSLLVCAYDDENTCRQHHLDGALHMAALQTRVATLPKETEIVFYCA